MAATQVGKRKAASDANRLKCPGGKRIKDEFAAYGIDVKIKHITENGNELGKPLVFGGPGTTDVDKFLRYVDGVAREKARARK